MPSPGIERATALSDRYVDLSDLIDDDEAEELQLEEYPESVDDPLNEVHTSNARCEIFVIFEIFCF
jgi:hypothetical protein